MKNSKDWALLLLCVASVLCQDDGPLLGKEAPAAEKKSVMVGEAPVWPEENLPKPEPAHILAEKAEEDVMVEPRLSIARRPLSEPAGVIKKPAKTTTEPPTTTNTTEAAPPTTTTKSTTTTTTTDFEVTLELEQIEDNDTTEPGIPQVLTSTLAPGKPLSESSQTMAMNTPGVEEKDEDGEEAIASAAETGLATPSLDEVLVTLNTPLAAEETKADTFGVTDNTTGSGDGDGDDDYDYDYYYENYPDEDGYSSMGDDSGNLKCFACESCPASTRKMRKETCIDFSALCVTKTSYTMRRGKLYYVRSTRFCGPSSCPPSSLMIRYKCCSGDLCNGSHRHHDARRVAMAIATAIAALLSIFMKK